MALGLPGEMATRHPPAPQLVNVRRTGRHLGADASRYAVEHRDRLRREAAVEIPPRHEDVAWIACDVQIFHVGMIGQAIQWQMALDRSAMSLLIERGEHEFERKHPVIEPRREFV